MKFTYGCVVAAAAAGLLAATISVANARDVNRGAQIGSNDRATAAVGTDPGLAAMRIDAAQRQAGLVNQLADKFQAEAASQFRGNFDALEWRLAFGSRLFHQSEAALTAGLAAADLAAMSANMARAVAPKHAGGLENVVTLLNSPCRIVDTRFGGGGMLGPTNRLWYASNTPAVIAAQGGNAAGCGTFPNAEFFLVYVTAVPPGAPLSGGASFLTLQHDPVSPPASSTLNFYPGINVATFATPSCQGCGGGTGGFYAFAASSTHVVIDLVGVGQPSTAPAGRARALVFNNATFDAARTSGFTAVTRPSTGTYCLTPVAGIDPTTSITLVTPEWSNSSGSTLAAYSRSCATCAGCAAADFAVVTYDFAGNLSNGVAFEVLVP
jgi:hypothetical protein